MVGQPVDIQGKVTGSALKTVDIYIDNAKYSSVSVGAATTEFTIKASWIPITEGVHAIQFKGLNDKGEVIVNSEAVVITVNGPTATPIPTQPAPATTQAVTVTVAAAQVEQSAAQPTVAAQSQSQGAQAAVKEGDYVNVRKGPDYTYDKIGTLDKGQSAVVTGKSADGAWWQIRFPAAPDGVGWVVGQLIQVSGDTNSVQVASAPPPPTAEPVAEVPTSPPAPAATQPPAPTAAAQLPNYAQKP
jgi:uncharacterized protein YraI